VEIINDTQLPAAFLVGSIAPPETHLTLIVKGTYDLHPGARATPSEEMLLPTGDEPYDDDPDAIGAPRYASDFAPRKPRADLLLVGHCWQPGGAARGACNVRFEVGGHGRNLDVHGEREWRRAWMGPGASASPPRPFTSMPLRYENAFGGPGWKPNPSGVGRRARTLDDGRRVRALPNVEDPGSPIRSPRSRPDPAGFGPLSAEWKLRRSKVGTYKKRWLKERWPGLPHDFDPTYWNAAPPKMQVPYLRGDEPLLLENLHPDHPRLESMLPGIRARAFACDRPPGEEGSGFREIPLELDMVWVDADALKLVLVWRGHTSIDSEDYDEDVAYLFLRSEPLAEPGPDLASHEQLLIERLREQAAEEEPEEFEEPAIEATPDRVDVNALAETEKQKLEAELAESGVPIDESPEPTAEAKAKEEELRERYGIGQPKPDALGRDDVLSAVAAGESLAGADLTGLDLSDAPLSGADLSGAQLAGANLARAELDQATLDGATLDRAILTASRLQGAQLAEADLTGADLCDADLSGAVANGASFDGARLDRATLAGLEAPDASFMEASLVDADLRGAQLAAAEFSETALDRARFDGASLPEASLEGAHGEAVVFDGADLTELRAADCRLPGASLRRVSATDSVWDAACLAGADLSYAVLRDALLIKADLTDATLDAVDLKQARLDGARLTHANAGRCNLFDAGLSGADLSGADLRGAHLFGADLIGARLDDAQLEGANMKRVRREP